MPEIRIDSSGLKLIDKSGTSSKEATDSMKRNLVMFHELEGTVKVILDFPKIGVMVDEGSFAGDNLDADAIIVLRKRPEPK